MKPASWLRAVASVTWIFFVTGCETPNVFRGETQEHPHAILVAENPPGGRGFMGQGRKISPAFINDHPTAFWRMRDSFRVPPGETVVDVIDAGQPYGYETIRFCAVAGRRYILRPGRRDGRDVVTLAERGPDTQTERVIATALRDLDKHHAR